MSGVTFEEEISGYQKYPDLGVNLAEVTAGRYKLKEASKANVGASNAEISSKVWFRSPPLTQQLISRLNSVQLFADSHDQGAADDESAGLWTWIDLVLLTDESAVEPIKKDGIELAWRSHRNSPLSSQWSWNSGKIFSSDSDILKLVQPGNTIGVRLCAQFAGWELSAREALFIFDISKQEVPRSPPPDYGQLLSNISLIQSTIDQVNHQNDAPLKPKVARQVLHRAGDLNTGKEGPLRVLALDGGGVRGYSTLLILQAVLDKAAPGKKPCEIFDLIGGTSTGGLIAIMLGQLQMSVAECIKSYEAIMGTVFTNSTSLTIFSGSKSFYGKGYFYDPAPLEIAIKNAIAESQKKNNIPENKEIAFNDGKPNPCKVFVLAVRKDATNNREPVFLRSYLNPLKKAELPTVKLWEAARATSAAPAYFPPMKIQGTELVDGGLAANNPLGWLWTEVATVYGAARQTDCFLSVGTGVPRNSALTDLIFDLSILDPNVPLMTKGLKLFGLLENISKAKTTATDFAMGLISAATNSESTNVLFKFLLDDYAPSIKKQKYFRLNFEEIDTKKTNSKDFEDLSRMDNAEPDNIKNMAKKTNDWIAKNKALVDATIDSLTKSLAARPTNQ